MCAEKWKRLEENQAWAGGVAQTVVACLPGKREAPSSSPHTANRTTKLKVLNEVIL
jgi:hypothetical protein